MAIMPLATLLFAHFATRDEKFTMPKLLGVGLGIFGVVLLVGPSFLTGLGGDLLHQGAILLAAGCYAFNAVLIKFLLNVQKLALVTLQLSFACLVMVPVAYFNDTVLAGFVLVVIVQRQGASFFSQINLLVPLFGVLWAFLIFSEQPSINAGVALFLILSGVIVARGKAQAETKIDETKRTK